MRTGAIAAGPNARPIVTRCRIRAATAKGAHLLPERAERSGSVTLVQLSGAFDPFAKPGVRSA
jgi:hypothetical protein